MCGRVAAAGRLRDHGSRLFALTDNTPELSGRQLEEAGEIDPLVGGRHVPRDPGGICLIESHVVGHPRCRHGELAGRAHSSRRQEPWIRRNGDDVGESRLLS